MVLTKLLLTDPSDSVNIVAMHAVNYKTTMKRRVLDLLLSRNMADTHANSLPKLGVIVISGQQTLAAGFLRRIEGEDKSAILDSLITNPTLDPDLRNRALDHLVNNLLKLAQANGITNILAFSTDKNTLMRAERFGFVELPHQVITLDLTS